MGFSGARGRSGLSWLATCSTLDFESDWWEVWQNSFSSWGVNYLHLALRPRVPNSFGAAVVIVMVGMVIVVDKGV